MIKKPTGELRQQIAALGERREQLQEELDAAVVAHGEAQQRLLAGDPTIVTATVAIHHSSVSSLREAIAALDADVSTLQQELEKAVLAEQQEASRRRLKKVAVEIGEAELIVRISRERADGALIEHLGGGIDALVRWQRLQAEYAQLQRTLGQQPSGKPRLHFAEQLTFGPEVDAALQRLWGERTRPSRQQRKQQIVEINRRMREGEERRRERSQPILKPHFDQRAPTVEPPRELPQSAIGRRPTTTDNQSQREINNG